MLNKRVNTRKLIFASVCVAIGIALPLAFHSIPQGGKIFLPMHLPVLLCGLVAGPLWGLGCGVLTPMLSSLFTGMPPAAMLPGMLVELSVYGLASGLLANALRGKNRLLGLYLPLVAAMLAGRVAGGLVNGFLFQAGAYTVQMWAAASFVTAVPGIIIQLVAVPALAFALEKAGLVKKLAPYA